MPTLACSAPSTQNVIYLAGTKGGRGRARGGSGRHTARAMAVGLGMPLLKGNGPKHAAAWQHWHSPLHSAGMQESVEKCLHQYSSFWSGKGNRSLRTRTCVNTTVLAKPEFGRKTNVAFIKPLCMPGPEREAQPAGWRAAGTKLTQELETEPFLPKQSTSELQEKNGAQWRVCHLQEIASSPGTAAAESRCP